MMIYWLWLVGLKGIGPILQGALLDKFQTPEAIYHATMQELLLVEGIGPRKAVEIYQNHTLDNAQSILNNCEKNQIHILPCDSIYYPERLRKISICPRLIYYKGDLDLLHYPMTAVVGSRRCTQKAKELTVQLVEQIAKQKNVIISGMAKGIDSYAHTACLKYGAKTIAVLGNGLDICYPSEHALLMKKIEENGLLISEYPPGYPPTQYSFPQRNRLIAALADRVIITEANKGSGAFITKEYAKQFGIPVYHETLDKSY